MVRSNWRGLACMYDYSYFDYILYLIFSYFYISYLISYIISHVRIEKEKKQIKKKQRRHCKTYSFP